MKIRSMSAIFLGALVLSFTSSLHATTLYNNLFSAAPGVFPISGFGPVAASFSTGAFNGDLSSVTLDLYEPDEGDTGTIAVDLLSDNSTYPGTVLETIGTIDDSLLSIDSFTDFYTLNTSYALNAETRYWVELSSNDTEAEWSETDDTSGTGVASEYHYGFNGEVVPNSDGGLFVMDVEGVSTSPVPEPPALLLLGTGLLGLLVLKLRRRLSSVSEGDFLVGNARF